MERYVRIFSIIAVVFTVILLILAFIVKVDPNATSGGQKTNCVNNLEYITNIVIGRSNKKVNSNYYCPHISSDGSLTKFPICDKLTNNCSLISVNDPIGNKPYAQVCYEKKSPICDQTNVVTDVKVVNMTDTVNGIYLPKDKRCCDNSDNCVYNPPISLDINNPDIGDAGELPIDILNCYKMGLCVKKTPLGDVKSGNVPYVTDVKFVAVEQNTPVGEVCDPGWIVDTNNLYENCKNVDKKMYMCKKFSQ